jgi:4-hydroxy-4-methyl-2-oxoglutarate aldolase
MTDRLTERLELCYTGILHDVMRGMGLHDFTLPPELRPILPAQVMAGPIFTIDGMVDRAADPHQTLLAWTGLLSQAPAGSVWVCQPNDREVAHMGELSAETLMNKGVRGCLVDGFARDINFLLEMRFQTWCRGYTPRDIVGHWLPRATNVAIRIGDVSLQPGDYLVADRDGAVCLPAGQAEAIADVAEAAIGKENLVREAILAGVDPQEAYLRHGKF